MPASLDKSHSLISNSVAVDKPMQDRKRNEAMDNRSLFFYSAVLDWRMQFVA